MRVEGVGKTDGISRVAGGRKRKVRDDGTEEKSGAVPDTPPRTNDDRNGETGLDVTG
jgi:hypothetical protein